ncbi:MAG: chorismate lyase [Gammaproteobacteria bacterium]
MFNPDKFQWRTFDASEGIPAHVLPWLLDNSSLTEKLKNKYSDFHVTVVSQAASTPYACELALLGGNSSKIIIVREVELMGEQQPVVFARSIIPKTIDTEKLLAIGSRPLGEILFDDPLIYRDQLEVGQHQNTWARRSTFVVGATKLLVSEIFLEKLYA